MYRYTVCNYGAHYSSLSVGARILHVHRVPIFPGDEDADWSVGVVEAIQSIRRSQSPRRRARNVVKRNPALFFTVIAGAEHEELPETLQRWRPFRSHETHDP